MTRHQLRLPTRRRGPLWFGTAALAAVLASTSTAAGAAVAAVAPAGPGGTRGPAGTQQVAHGHASQTAGGPGDVAVTGSGDLTGYHLYLASRQG
ncbi:MAG TPA: hypothetical protein VGS19_36980, partial [Streptosporangiaceae bacterium]|nr:hypothetical protein [Streptosporangiaceae bacterium]